MREGTPWEIEGSSTSPSSFALNFRYIAIRAVAVCRTASKVSCQVRLLNVPSPRQPGALQPTKHCQKRLSWAGVYVNSQIVPPISCSFRKHDIESGSKLLSFRRAAGKSP